MKTLHLYNSMTRQKEVFTPIDPTHVRMYACGPTVYDFIHIGNARSAITFDILYRLLKRHYPRVTYVQNITDIDDKIINQSIKTGEAIDSITTRHTENFLGDIKALNAIPADIYPRATEHIPQMIAMIETLVQKNHAYVKDGHVLFHVPSMQSYGELSRLSRDNLIAGARVDVAPYKKDHADFVLWKPSTTDQPGWDSPWGRGRPGWHIECSAMSKAHLGITFDIHGGGIDLIFPHHENEIAQSCCAHDGAKMANYWMHNGFLTMNSQKMSKSIGNLFTVRELLDRGIHGEVLRLILLSAQYRQPLDFSESDAAITNAKTILDKWYRALLSVKDIKPAKLDPLPDFEEDLLDDLNTPAAIAKIHKTADALMHAQSDKERAIGKGVLLAEGLALGLLQQNPEKWFKETSIAGGLSDSDIEQKITARAEAKKAKDFARADALRKELADAGIILEDNATGTTWRRV